MVVLGLVHDHIWGILRQFEQTGRVNFVAAADANPRLIDKVRNDFGISRTYTDYRQLFEDCSPDIDIAAVYIENNRGHELVKACAGRGIDVIIEKPMSATLAQADEMMDDISAHGIKLMVNWPSAWSPELVKAMEMIGRGDIGKLYKLRVICSHGGPKEIGCDESFWSWLYDSEKNGGGALMDYCCYGTALCSLLLGRPKAVTAMKGRYVKDYIDVDDNAVILAGYDDAIGICEASWTEATHLYSQQFFGTKGDLFCEDGSLKLVSRQGVKSIDVPELPAHLSNAPSYFIHCLDTGEPISGLCNPKISRDAQEILEAAKAASTVRLDP